MLGEGEQISHCHVITPHFVQQLSPCLWIPVECREVGLMSVIVPTATFAQAAIQKLVVVPVLVIIWKIVKVLALLIIVIILLALVILTDIKFLALLIIVIILLPTPVAIHQIIVIAIDNIDIRPASIALLPAIIALLPAFHA